MELKKDLEFKKEGLKDFVLNFFNLLQSKIEYSNSIYEVYSTSEEFQKNYGKITPFKFTFEKDKESNEIELIVNGSRILKSISSFLEKKGETSSLFLIFEEDFLSAFKKYIRIKNANVSDIIKSYSLERIYKFTYNTSFQYLNEKENITSSVIVYNGNIEKINLDLFNYSPFVKNIDSLIEEEIKKAYLVSKEEIKNIISPKIKQTSEILREKLEKEEDRINHHYEQRKKEIEEQINKISAQIKEPKIQEDKRTKLIQLFKEEEKKLPEILNKIETEKSFLLKDQQYKHSLNLSTKLLTKTIIHFPIFNFKIVLKSKKKEGFIDINYNPITKKLYPEISCSSCNKKEDPLFLCLSGHISCPNCTSRCGECMEEMCKKCIKRTCNLCSKEICKSCSESCSLCNKNVCQSHCNINTLSGKKACNNCLKQCSNCLKYYPKGTIINKEQICKACSLLKSVNSHLTNSY